MAAPLVPFKPFTRLFSWDLLVVAQTHAGFFFTSHAQFIFEAIIHAGREQLYQFTGPVTLNLHAGNICIYCPGGPDSDFEYSTQVS